MEIARLSFNKQFPDLALERNSITFRPGDVVQAVVQAVNEEWALLGFEDRTVLAQTAVPLEKGQKLYLQVDKLEEGQTFLKVLNLRNNSTEANDLTIRGLVQKLGFPEDPFYADIVKGMVANQLPVTPENIRAVNRMVATLGGREKEEALSLALWLLGRNSEISSLEAGRALMSFFKTEPRETIDAYRTIFQFLDVEDNGKLPLLEQMNSNQVHRQETIQAGEDLLNDSRIIPSMEERAVNESGEKVRQDLMRSVLPELAEIIFGAEDKSLAAGKIKSLLIDQMRNIEEMNEARETLVTKNESLLHQFHQALDKIKDHFAGQSLYNYLDKNADDNTKSLYFLVPFRWQQEVRYAELAISWPRGSRQREVPTDKLTVNIGVETANLGRIVFHLLADGNKIGIGVYLEEEQSKAVIDKEIPSLICRLEGMGYHPQYLGSQVVSGMRIKPELKNAERQNMPAVTALDIRI